MSEPFNDGSLPRKARLRPGGGGLYERVGNLEVQIGVLGERIETVLKELTAAGDSRQAMHEEIKKLREDIVRLKGIWAGVLLCLSVIGALLALFRTQLSAALVRLIS